MRSVLFIRLCKLLAIISVLAWANFLTSLWMYGINPAGITSAFRVTACASITAALAATLWLMERE